MQARTRVSRSWPGWLVACVGWFAADLAVRAVDLPGRSDRAIALRQAATPARWVDRGALVPAELSTWTVRELRGLPGIGPKRAVAIARARWSRERSAGPLQLDDVVGIGPRTVANIAAELAQRSDPDGRADSLTARPPAWNPHPATPIGGAAQSAQ